MTNSGFPRLMSSLKMTYGNLYFEISCQILSYTALTIQNFVIFLNFKILFHDFGVLVHFLLDFVCPLFIPISVFACLD